MTERGRLFCGTSGFSFKEWKGNFYPEDLPDKKMLQFYSSMLDTVEINYTFRRMPSESTMTNWKSQVPEGFRFTLKAPQRITHFKKLKEVGEDVDEFIRRARLLEDAIGTVLFQLPPTLKYDRDLLEPFATSLPPGCRYAMEFRHDSWKDPEVAQILSEHHVAVCGADTEAAEVDQVPVTAPHVYLRLRKESYEDNEIKGWSEKVSSLLAGGSDVYCYFKHEGGGVGPAYAKRLKELVAAAT